MRNSPSCLAPYLLFPLLLAFASLTAQSQESITVAGVDGYPLKGHVWSGAEGGAAVLLLHQCDRDQRMYRDLAARLAAEGLHVLTYDLRGIGESATEALDITRQPERDFWPRAEGKFAGDLAAVTAFLRAAQGVDGDRLGILGASCGGAQAIDLSRSPTVAPAVKALAFLSCRMGSGQVDGLRPLEASVPTFWIAAEDDRRAAEAARYGKERSRHPASELRIYPGRDHGAPLLERDPGLVKELVRWFSKHLSGSG